ncbi:uncharacterized protein METZ01_LOCUS109785 [marine metagenome]|uniref:Uncharacterized protein n=1 Tax=marine metagenome TaxID=408172 RepID=A0A381WXF4_9ZZZZ
MIFKTSPGSGNLDSFCLEKTFFPSTTTSKSPLFPETSSESTPKAFFNSAARPAARGS